MPALRAPVLALTGGDESPAAVAAAVEFVLEGLHLSKRLNKDDISRATYRSQPVDPFMPRCQRDCATADMIRRTGAGPELAGVVADLGRGCRVSSTTSIGPGKPRSSTSP